MSLVIVDAILRIGVQNIAFKYNARLCVVFETFGSHFPAIALLLELIITLRIYHI